MGLKMRWTWKSLSLNPESYDSGFINPRYVSISYQIHPYHSSTDFTHSILSSFHKSTSMISRFRNNKARSIDITNELIEYINSISESHDIVSKHPQTEHSSNSMPYSSHHTKDSLICQEKLWGSLLSIAIMGTSVSTSYTNTVHSS